MNILWITWKNREHSPRPPTKRSPGKTLWHFQENSGSLRITPKVRLLVNISPNITPKQSHRLIPNMSRLILASASAARRSMLQNSGISFESLSVRIDEDGIKQALMADGATPRDIADTLAEFKARKAAEKMPAALTLGSDQILSLQGQVFSKPTSRQDAANHLNCLSGKTHHLYSAAVIYEDGKPVWRAVGTARLSMHRLTESEISAYLEAAWPEVASSVGAYQAEALGGQLFSRIDGDWFSVLGMPLLQVLSYLRMRGMLAP